MAALETIVKYVRHLTGLLLLAGIIALGMASGMSNPAWAQLALQPADKHSTLPDKNLNFIRDDEFAKLMQDNLIKGGASQVKDAKFLFQECYGGGMLDDLQMAFGSLVSWVGGSASRYDQLSGGQISTLEKTKETNVDSIYVANPPQDYWTKALVPQLGMSQTLLQSINNARDKDQVGVKGFIGHFEDGQSITANSGENITLQDVSTTSHYAILWAGYTDHLRHYSDIDNLQQALQTAWQGTNYQINILYGDGLHETAKGQYDTVPLPASWNQGQVSTKEGTLANLKTTLANIAQNLGTDADFCFFASNHGGVLTEVPTTSAPVLPDNHAVETFILTKGELIGMGLKQQKLNGIADTILTIGYDKPDDGLINALVSINGHLLGSLDPEATETQFGIPVNFLSLDNEIDIFNVGLVSITLKDQYFYTGNIDSNLGPVPIPPSVVLLGSGLLGCARGFKGFMARTRPGKKDRRS
jgi:hypothetical protein